MLSKNKIKFFNSLKLRKFRIKHNLFLAEGEKLVFNLLQSEIKPKFILTTSKKLIPEIKNKNVTIIEINDSENKKLSMLKTPSEIIGIFEIPKYSYDFNDIEKTLNLFCDDIQNPGNLGTIIRTADWFGIKNIFCSIQSADVFNPKTIQATMGAIATVTVHYVDKKKFFSSLNEETPVYGTFLEGEDIYNTKLKKNGIIVIGNEGKGISDEIAPYISHKLLIPDFNSEKKASESLNVSAATAIICSEFKRR